MHPTPVSVPSRRRRLQGRRPLVLAVALALTASVGVVGSGAPVAADAGPDVSLSKPGGPAGSEVEVFSLDVFDMGVDRCPGITRPDDTYGPTDTFEVRWELGVLAGEGTPLQPGVPDGFRYALATDRVTEVLDSGVVETTADEPWRTTVTIPAGAQPGDALVVDAECWRTGPDVPGGAEVSFGYYYLAVFVVTGPDGVIPVPTTVAPVPPPTAPAAPAASARPGSASLTG